MKQSEMMETERSFDDERQDITSEEDKGSGRCPRAECVCVYICVCGGK